MAIRIYRHRHRPLRVWPVLSVVALLLLVYWKADLLGLPLPSVFLAAPVAPTGRTAAAILPQETIDAHINAILSPEDTTFDRLECPTPDLSRYQYLKPAKSSQTRYMFALNLRNNTAVLPRLLGTVVEAIRFLGPQACALSIVEGNSEDGTPHVLEALEPELHKSGIGRTHFVVDEQTNPLVTERFSSLARLRNLALAPLVDEQKRYSHPNTTVIFVNDVALCMEDILELVHQRFALGADMTCGMDWIIGHKKRPLFYDVFVSRSMAGDTFFKIPAPLVSWDFADDLFWDHPPSWDRFFDHKPFQVFSCWNGVVAFGAAPVVRKEVEFRGQKPVGGECLNGEPHYFCKDLWVNGYDKIAVVPSVNVAYSDEETREAKKTHGYVWRWTHDEEASEIQWQPPPDEIKCMPVFNEQSWRPWNETYD
ncbi:hypothetical protein GQ53DRAFT_208743 [Thozetella sp. PMI_491]|nr:hypothetical protein GQ53DRAFT_208743 [Thozetella sp. PMI_491]